MCLLKEPGTEFSTMSGLARLRSAGSWIYVAKRVYQSNDDCIMGDTKLSTNLNDIFISLIFVGCDWFIHHISYYLWFHATWLWQTQNFHRNATHASCTMIRLRPTSNVHWAMEGKSPQKAEKVHWWVDPSIKTCDNIWQLSIEAWNTLWQNEMKLSGFQRAKTKASSWFTVAKPLGDIPSHVDHLEDCNGLTDRKVSKFEDSYNRWSSIGQLFGNFSRCKHSNIIWKSCIFWNIFFARPCVKYSWNA